MMPNNTKFWYMYRDAANYKVHSEVVLSGTMSEEQWETIVSCCDGGEFFAPQKVGLEARAFVALGYKPYDDDPELFEIVEYSLTNAEPTIEMTVDELVEKFQTNKGKWYATA
jgi:hypothetical protein